MLPQENLVFRLSEITSGAFLGKYFSIYIARSSSWHTFEISREGANVPSHPRLNATLVDHSFVISDMLLVN